MKQGCHPRAQSRGAKQVIETHLVPKKGSYLQVGWCLGRIKGVFWRLPLGRQFSNLVQRLKRITLGYRGSWYPSRRRLGRRILWRKCWTVWSRGVGTVWIRIVWSWVIRIWIVWVFAWRVFTRRVFTRRVFTRRVFAGWLTCWWLVPWSWRFWLLSYGDGERDWDESRALQVCRSSRRSKSRVITRLGWRQ